MYMLFVPGPSQNGAGSGGRIAIILTKPLIYQGVIISLGGLSVSKHHGSPGTVYVETNIGNVTHRFLKIDNAGRSESHPVFLAEGASEEYYFDEVRLLRSGVLRAKQVRQRFDYIYYKYTKIMYYK